MKRQEWADDQVMNIVNSEFNSVSVNVVDPKNEDILVHYNVGGTPITIITDSNGNALKWRVGGIEKSEFIELLSKSNLTYSSQRK